MNDTTNDHYYSDDHELGKLPFGTVRRWMKGKPLKILLVAVGGPVAAFLLIGFIVTNVFHTDLDNVSPFHGIPSAQWPRVEGFLAGVQHDVGYRLTETQEIVAVNVAAGACGGGTYQVPAGYQDIANAAMKEAHSLC